MEQGAAAVIAENRDKSLRTTTWMTWDSGKAPHSPKGKRRKKREKGKIKTEQWTNREKSDV